MKLDYEGYLEEMDKYININWNLQDIYEKMVDSIIKKYEEDKISFIGKK
jgi:hypothetical protein